MAMSRVGVAELKNNLSRHLRAVQTGEVIEVTDHDRPIARLVPVASGSRMNLRGPARPFADVRDTTYEPLELPFDPLDILYEDRRKR
jgi:prevent-host-death family protein